MDQRQWLFDRLSATTELTSVVGERIFAAGSMEGAVQVKPFVVIRVGNTFPEMMDDNVAEASSCFPTIWIHDEPGSYKRIDQLLQVVRSSLTDAITTGLGIQCIWQGDSQEFTDDLLGTIVRNSSYKLIGREQTT